ncbi:FecR family protein [Paenalcaligenes sp. Me131]|uniref:FecR family protein n=1 Tax=Paenalcaligenes sp. Me131 TaxID=3392636 RepID=UPI003D29B4AC
MDRIVKTSPLSQEQIQEQALDWFTRTCLGSLSAEQCQERDRWRAQYPEHEAAYQALETSWKLADALPKTAMHRWLRHNEQQAKKQTRRRMLGWGGGALAMLSVGAVLPLVWPAQPLFTDVVASAKGQRREVMLPDGSKILLNTDSEVAIAYYADRRDIQFVRGEALFSVLPDVNRPFTVRSGELDVRVVGTQFSVRQERSQTSVVVREGVVEVFPSTSTGLTGVRLSAGYTVAASATAIGNPQQVAVESVLAWQRGRLVFQDNALSEVVRELNRYMVQPIQVQDKALGRMRVSGTVSVENPDAILDILPKIAPVSVVRVPERGVFLLPLGG